MECKCSITSGDECVCVHVDGEVTLPDAKRIAAAAHAAVQEHACRRILVDAREAVVRLSLLDLYELGESASRLMLGAVDGVALVVPAESLQPDRFFERVCQNRGLKLQVFTDLDEAVQWLKAA